MTVLESEVVVLEQTDPEDKVSHIVCHCNINLAWCKLWVGDLPYDGDLTDEDAVCPLCALFWEENPGVCPWGCSCTDAEAFCGDKDEDEEEEEYIRGFTPWIVIMDEWSGGG